MGERTEYVQDADISEVLQDLAEIIHTRALERPEQSYTVCLLEGSTDKLLSKLVEEALEVALAAKDDDHDHIRYEMGDLLYHLLVIAEKYQVSLEELAGELKARME